MANSSTRTVVINPQEELRFGVDWDVEVKVKVTHGTAEIFGTELAENVVYGFTGKNLAVFSWKGCVIEITGPTTSESLVPAKDSVVPSYLNIHVALEQLREDADDAKGEGPRVMVVGSKGTGKSALAKTLSSWTIKMGRTPLYVDLDIEEGSTTIPATISAMCLTKIIDHSMGYSLANSLTSSASGDIPLVYHYGFTTHSENFRYYKLLVEKLSRDVDKKIENDFAARCSGLILDTCGNVEEFGLDAIKHAAEVFKVTTILVIEDRSLFDNLSSHFSTKPSLPCILNLRKSSGCVTHDSTYRKTMLSRKIREYFYGVPGKLDLSPHMASVPWAFVKVVRVGDGSITDPSPHMSSTNLSDDVSIVHVTDGNILIHSVLSVVLDSEEFFKRKPQHVAKDADNIEMKDGKKEEEVDLSPVVWRNSAGFAYVSDYNEVTKKLSLLVPFPGRIGKKVLMMGALKWRETV